MNVVFAQKEYGMKMPRSLTLFLLVTLLTVGLVSTSNAGLRLGGGIHYLRTVGDMKDIPGFDENSIGIIGSAKYKMLMFTIEGDMEVIPDYVGSEELMVQPQAYLLLGNFFYGGAGVGVGYLSKFGWQDPFYALRAGVDFTLGPVDLDVFASFRFQKAKDLKALDKEDLHALTLGALINFAFGGI
jgi:hypothetical protein